MIKVERSGINQLTLSERVRCKPVKEGVNNDPKEFIWV